MINRNAMRGGIIDGMGSLLLVVMLLFLSTNQAIGSITDKKSESKVGDDVVIADDKKWGFKGYSGGMFYHLGYVRSNEFMVYNLAGEAIPTRIEGMTSGIGGKLGFFLNKYVRAGIEGYSTTTRYGEFRNSYKVGWGGLVMEFVYPTKRVMPFIGLTLGGGKMKNMILLAKDNNDYHADEIIYKEDGLFIINPAIGIEYFVSKRISLIFKVDYMISGSKDKFDFATGPRAYIGVHFYRKK